MEYRKAGLAIGAMVLAAVVGHVVFVTRADLWETDVKPLRIAEQARRVLDSGGRVASWEKAYAKVVFYFGRDIPSAAAYRDRLVRLHGESEGMRQWGKWLHEGQSPLWIVGHGKDVQALSAMGFVPAAQAAVEAQSPDELLLFQPRPGGSAGARGE